MTLLTVDRKNGYEGSSCSVRISTDELVLLQDMTYKMLENCPLTDDRYDKFKHMHDCMAILVEIARYGSIDNMADIIGIEAEYYRMKAAQQWKPMEPTYSMEPATEIAVMDC